MSDDLPWFFIVIEGLTHPSPEADEIGQQGYYCQRRLLGEAIACAMSSATTAPNHLTAVSPTYVAVVDSDEMEGELYATDIDNLIESDELYVRPLAEGRTFRYPIGCVPSGWQPDGVELDSMREGFLAADTEAGFVLEAQVENQRLRHILERLLETVPVIDSIVVVLLDHYDSLEAINGESREENAASCLVKELAQPTQIALEIDSIAKELFGNGHVDIGFSAQATPCTIWLTEHKTLHVVTTEQALRERMKQVLRDEGLEELAELPSFAQTFSHFHYRTADSLAAEQLTSWLQSRGWQLEFAVE
jgi:hypothetical protein